MTDYLPPPPAEIVLEPTLADRYDPWAKFVYKSNDSYFETDAHYFEVVYQAYNKNVGRIFNLEETLREAVASESIDMDLATQFAEVLGISLSRTINFTVTIEVAGSMEVGHDVDVDDVLNNLNVSIDTGYYDNVEDADFDDINFTYVDWREE